MEVTWIKQGDGKPDVIAIETIEQKSAAALHLFKQGCFPIEVAAALDIDKDEFAAMINPQHDDYEPMLAKVVAKGLTYCEAYWLKFGREGAHGVHRTFNANTWISFMKQNFGWQDKTVVETKDDSQQSMDAMLSWFRGMSADERAAIVQMRRDMTDDRHAQHQGDDVVNNTINTDALSIISSRVDCEQSLSEFLRQSWGTFEPAKYIHGWHLDAICQHLEAIARGQIKNLIINIPPRHAKSITCNVAFPAWVWSQPNKTATSGNGVRFLNATHSHDLAMRDSVKCRQIIKSQWYQDRWGGEFSIRRDSDTKGEFNLTSGGGRMITSVDSRNTGHGGEILIFDDVVDAREIASKTVRDGVIDWWDGTMSTRGNSADTARIVIMQRLHEQDLVGHILANERKDWEHLCLPAEYERNHIFPCRTSLGYIDPRKDDGDLLWDARFTRKQIDALKNQLGDKAAGQLQQRPSVAGGSILKSASWQKWSDKKLYPNFTEVLQFYDTALEAGEQNDFSACTTWGVFERNDEKGNPVTCAMILGRWKDKVEYPAMKAHALESYKKWKPDQVVIERKASGHILLQDLRKTGLPVKAFDPKAKSKPYRAQMGSDVLDGGRIFYPDRDWAREVIDECSRFPKGLNDDIVDTCVMAMLYLRRTVLTLDDDDSIDDNLSAFGSAYSNPNVNQVSFY